MKRLLAVLLAAAIALPVAADTQVVCTITAQSNTACSAITVSEASQLAPCQCSPNGDGGSEPSVYDDAIALWKLDEQSGTRADSIGSNDLTDNNTVGSVNSGPEGVVAKFVAANSEYLSAVDDGAGLSIDGDHTFTAWVYRDTAGANLAILSQRTSGDGSYQLYVDTNDKLHAYITDSSSGYSEPVTAASLPVDAWSFCVFTYTASDKKARVYFNEGTVAAGAALTNGPLATTQDFNIGRLAASVYGDSQIARVGTWTRVLSGAEITALFNSGSGKRYDELTDAEKVGLVSYWDLTETSGTRSDFHGTNHLTDNNTVGSATNSYPANLPGRVANFVAANSEYLSLASDSTLDLNGGDYTFAFWVKFTTLPGELYPLGRDTAGSLTQYFFNSTASSVTFTAQDDPFSSTTTVSTGGGSVSTATWYLVVAGREGSNLFISLDGGAKTTGALTITPATGAATFFLGARRAAYGHMNGQMSAVAVWDRALSADDITALYNSGDGAPLP